MPKPRRWYFHLLDVGESVLIDWEDDEKYRCQWGLTYSRIKSALRHARHGTGYRYSTRAEGTHKNGGIRVTRTA